MHLSSLFAMLQGAVHFSSLYAMLQGSYCSSMNILFIDSTVSPPFSLKSPAVLCYRWKCLFSIRDYSKHPSFHSFLSLKIFILVPWGGSFYHKIKDQTEIICLLLLRYFLTNSFSHSEYHSYICTEIPRLYTFLTNLHVSALR